MNQNTETEFANHVRTGLSSSPKWLSSRYIYDDAGSKLFEGIMRLPEYYLSRAEYAILEQRSDKIASQLHAWESFDIVEFGAGDGTKTRLLLQELSKSRKFRYLPVDISEAALETIKANFARWLPELELVPQQAEYFAALDSLRSSGRPLLVLFLGSNIGNFTHVQTLDFLHQLQGLLQPGDCVLTGFDLKKDPRRILAAYNDSQGLTRDFSKNLLARINRELGGQFDLSTFDFVPSYNPETGEMHAFLMSHIEQRVLIDELDLVVPFAAWETIHTEVSRKYDLSTVEALARDSGFRRLAHFYDASQDFVDSLWQVD